MQHLIKKQIIALNLPKEAEAFKIQQAVSDHYRQDILPLMEQVFDQLCPNDEVIQLDKLEIDLGLFKEEILFSNRWPESLLLKIKDQLNKKITVKIKEGAANRESVILNVCRQWLFYMQKGYLPWNSIQANETWYKQVLEAFAIDFGSVSELRQLILARPDVLKRIVLQHNEIFLTKLIEVLTTEKQSHLPEAIEELQKLFSYKKDIFQLDKEERKIKVNIWEQVLQLATSTEKQLKPDQLIKKILVRYLPDAVTTQKMIDDIPLKGKIIFPILKRFTENPEIFSTEKQTIRKSAPGYPERNKEKVVLPDILKIKTEKSIDEEGIFVPCAGIVLVHPFFPSLFKRLDWLKEKAFKTKEIQQKALYLLFYLANNHYAAEEHELIVPKILCGWPVEMPVEKGIALKEDEQNEADNMLRAAIEHWKVLKKSSIAALREGFLQRNGKLFAKNNKRYLQVENKSIDVLLDQLPWNLSIIKHSWMKEILRVEWR